MLLMRDGTGVCPSLMRLISRSLITLLCVLSLSRVWFFMAPLTVAPQTPLSMEVFKQDSGVGYHFLLQGIVPTQGLILNILRLLYWQADSLPLAPPGNQNQSLSWVRLCDHMDCSPPGSSVHGVLQARTLEWVAIPLSRGSSQPRD